MNRVIIGLIIFFYFSICLVSVNANPLIDEEFCKDSTLGKQACLSKVKKFLQSNDRMPVTDEEMAAVYGCYKLNFLDKIFNSNSNMIVCED